MRRSCLAVVLIAGLAAAEAHGQTQATRIPLPAPDSGGPPLMQVLRARQSAREFSKQPLPVRELSNLLWAAFGINRPESGRRTAPSAMNWQEIQLYVAAPDGLFRYVASDHSLERIHDRDIRAATGTQPFVAQAAVNLVYVADQSRIGANVSVENRRLFSAMNTGFIAENAYLYCAAAGLATVVRALFDREALAKEMGLGENQWIVLAQSVGYPAR